jgi:hypothetical protein
MLNRITRAFWLLAAKLSRTSVAKWFLARIELKLGRIARRLGAPATDALQAVLTDEQRRKLADEVIQLLLYAMSVITLLKPGFQEANLPREFKAKLVFKTRRTEDSVECSAVFEDGIMRERKGSVANPDAVIVFKDGLSLFNYVFFSRDHDVVNLLLENRVEIDGNLSLVYKFMYMVRSLIRPLGLT